MLPPTVVCVDEATVVVVADLLDAGDVVVVVEVVEVVEVVGAAIVTVIEDGEPDEMFACVADPV
ncbi:MAG: hypothetical protein RL419_142 [Actinomycetota bacterium]